MKDPKTGLTLRTLNAVEKYIAETMIKNNPKYSWTQALRDSGYSQRYVENFAAKIWSNEEVQGKINSYKAKAAVKAELTIAQVLDDLDYGIKLAREQGDLMAIARFCELRGKYLSMFTDKIHYETPELSAIAESISEAERPLLQAAIADRLKMLAQTERKPAAKFVESVCRDSQSETDNDGPTIPDYAR